ncbi:MAG TPA: hypothetical protein VFA74_14325 [Terriglobales bacterium]|nr:hypothetical protein [Terriglobales bacterium]
MTRQQNFSGSFRPIAGPAFIGIGLHILSGDLDRATAHVNQMLGNIAEKTLEMLPHIVLELSNAIRSYCLHHNVSWLVLLRMLISCWALLLVIVGTMFIGGVGEEPAALPEPAYFRNKVDNVCRFCCPSFDA